MFVHKRAEISPVQSGHFRRREWPPGMVAVHPSRSQGESRKLGGKHLKNLAIAAVRGQLSFIPWNVFKLYPESPSLTLVALHTWRKICSCFNQLQTPFCVLRKLMYGFKATKKKGFNIFFNMYVRLIMWVSDFSPDPNVTVFQNTVWSGGKSCCSCSFPCWIPWCDRCPIICTKQAGPLPLCFINLCCSAP